jgi:hypothetical protein
MSLDSSLGVEHDGAERLMMELRTHLKSKQDGSALAWKDSQAIRSQRDNSAEPVERNVSSVLRAVDA